MFVPDAGAVQPQRQGILNRGTDNPEIVARSIHG